MLHRVRIIGVAMVAVALCVAPAFSESAQGAPREFRSPTGNIICGWLAPGEAFVTQRLICATRNDNFAVMFGPSGRARGGYTQLDLPPVPRHVLGYGRIWRRGAFSCEMSRGRGVTCMNRSGHGFSLNRDQFIGIRP